jgi:L-ascorbate metabolism protein UlaG (beta-lactamase superfamily)
MHIIWQGQSCFQLIATRQKGEQVSIVIDPFDDETGLKAPSLAGDILLITHDHHDHNNKKAVKGTPFIIEGPGEYESKEVYVQGIVSFHGEDKKELNTIYIIEAEGLKICHLGDFGQKELTPEQLEKIGDIDILMVPVGGEHTVDSKGAAKIISQIEPHIAVPMHYALPKLKIKLDGVEQFLKEMGKKSVEPQPKLLIKKKDLTSEETQVVVLTA